MIPIAGQLLHEISARFEAVDGKAAAGAGLIGADDRTAGAAGAGHISDLENSPLNGFAGDAVIFPDHERREGGVLEADGFALVSMDNDRLSEGFLELESVRRFQLCDGKFAGVQPLAQLVDPDLTLGVRDRKSVV